MIDYTNSPRQLQRQFRQNSVEDMDINMVYKVKSPENKI